MDPREEVKYYDFIENGIYNNHEEVINIINAINYSANTDNYVPVDRYFVRRVYYSKDWYIAETYRGIVGECLDNDYRAREEYESYMSLINQENQNKTLKRELN